MNTSINMDIPAYVKVAADPARVIGLNTVGMTRNDISSESISLIKKAFKLTYMKKLKIDHAIDKIKNLNKNKNDPYLDIFIKSIELSERGILR
jgi:UDP-N-acetylglucosamine acyltransferase